jgi:hypothetical protein
MVLDETCAKVIFETKMRSNPTCAEQGDLSLYILYTKDTIQWELLVNSHSSLNLSMTQCWCCGSMTSLASLDLAMELALAMSSKGDECEQHWGS